MKGLNRTQLKIIAICAMVCDHLAWGFLDFFTPLAQVMHIIGRFTIPIMCFFIAEGFRHTSDLKRYFRRMICFWLISVLPFYLFFGKLYDYRQNIIFDLLLGLTLLTILEHPSFAKWQKGVLTAGVLLVSAFIGGWPMMPTLFILVFYYVRDFKKQVIWICSLTVTLVLFLTTAISLNNIYHFSHYDWVWYDKIYLLGFILPLLILKFYNGQKGKTPFSPYFFYIFYPAHFVVLVLLKKICAGITSYEVYIMMQVAALLILFAILIKVATVKPSRAQTATLMVIFFAVMYTFGFLIEITAISTEVCYAAIKIEYLGECLLIIAFTLFIKELCHKVIPSYIYVLEILIGTVTMWCIFTVGHNRFFYKSMSMNTDGPFPRVALSYNTGFYLFTVYLALCCIAGIIICMRTEKNCFGVERKRLRCCICAIICPWIPILLRTLGLTGGYEIPSLGIVGSALFICLALLKYGFFDSVALAGENALKHGNEGILVINTNHRVVYANHSIQELFGSMTEYSNAYDIPLLQDIFEGNTRTLELNDKMYEMRVEPLMESGYLQGYMLWALNMTEHYRQLMKVTDIAKKDALTGIYNRNFFETELTSYLENSGSGAMFMLDLDNFKQVNDAYGHQAGDDVLLRFGRIIDAFPKSTCLSCRIGGDEFCLFFKQITNPEILTQIAEKIIEDFKESLAETKYPDITAVSIGIAVCNPAKAGKIISYTKLYSRADRALYMSKNSGKNTWHFYS